MPSQQRAFITRQNILETAGRIIVSHGFTATTMKHIFTAANISSGALSFHFSTKEALAECLIDEEEETARRLRDKYFTSDFDGPLVVIELGRV